MFNRAISSSCGECAVSHTSDSMYNPRTQKPKVGPLNCTTQHITLKLSKDELEVLSEFL